MDRPHIHVHKGDIHCTIVMDRTHTHYTCTGICLKQIHVYNLHVHLNATSLVIRLPLFLVMASACALTELQWRPGRLLNLN